MTQMRVGVVPERENPESDQGQQSCDPGAVRHILTVDVEDYFQVEAFADSIPRETWDQFPSRVVQNTCRLLDLFETHSAKVTFFFLGWVAERFPALVREVQARGHEVACHSYWHRPVYTLTPEEFRNDTRSAIRAIEDAAGAHILGYRAPTWSITQECLWALDILAEEGFVYDSSIYPIRHDLYGIPGARRFPYRLACSNGFELLEFPPATIRLAGVNFPAAGGGYLRIFPLAYTRWVLRQFEERYRQPAVIYFHPWEIDRDQPRLNGKLRSRLRHYTNLSEMTERIISLLRRHTFQTFREVLYEERASSEVVKTGW